MQADSLPSEPPGKPSSLAGDGFKWWLGPFRVVFQFSWVSPKLEGIDEDGNIRPESEEMVMEQLRASFRPEFLNRLDEIIMFKPLTKGNISGIVTLLIKDINKRLSERQISIELTEEAKEFIVEHGYDSMYGARPLKRYLQKHVETLAARAILADGVREGDTIVIKVQEGKLVAEIK